MNPHKAAIGMRKRFSQSSMMRLSNSTALYDYKPRTMEMMAGWFDAKSKGKFPVIGIENDSGELMGFGSDCTFRAWRDHLQVELSYPALCEPRMVRFVSERNGWLPFAGPLRFSDTPKKRFGRIPCRSMTIVKGRSARSAKATTQAPRSLTPK